MRILHVTNHFYPCVGGIEQHVLDLCENLIKRGHVSDVLCLNKCINGGILPSKERYKGINIIRIPFVDMKYYKIGKGVLEHLKNYDIIHVHGLGYFFDLIASTRGSHKKRVILSTHGGFFHTKSLQSFKKIHFQTITRMMLRKVDKIVAVSKNDLETFSKVSGNIGFIPNGIDCRKYFRGKKQKSTFVYVGRISKNKRIDNLIKTFRLVIERDRGVKLFILGEDFDHLRPSLEKQVKEWGLENNIIFTGKVLGKRKLEYLAKSRFFVSASGYEGFGISVIEGMASGCIPILNNIPTFRAITNSFIVDYSNHKKSANKILSLLGRKLESVQKSSVKKSREYDWKEVMRRWESVYG